MQGVKTKSGLPQPYNMSPKKKGFLTTPMKKLLIYVFVLSIFGYLIYSSAPKPQKVDTEYELDNENKIEEKIAKNVMEAGNELKDKLGDIDLADAHADSNHRIED